MDDVFADFADRRVTFPIQYLGLPLTLGRIKMVHLQYIQDRARGKLAGWQGKTCQHRRAARAGEIGSQFTACLSAYCHQGAKEIP
jgi:hypothetical protein